MDAVMIDVRRVVGRENSNSQTTSLLLLACGACWGQNNVAWRNGGNEEGLPRLEWSTSTGPSFQRMNLEEDPRIVRNDEVREGRLRYRRNRDWAASI